MDRTVPMPIVRYASVEPIFLTTLYSLVIV